MPKLSDEERTKLVQKLQDDLEDFVAEKSLEARNNPRPEDTRSIDEIIEEMNNHPAFMKEIDYSKPLSPAMEGLMQIKYESENPTLRATSYKEDGNEEFKKKKYKIAIKNYTEGITSKSPDLELNAILYTNRAAAQAHLGNYRSSFMDCIFARKFKVDHMKAILRGVDCCFQMKKFADSIRWCDAGLMVEPENKILLEKRAKSEQGKKAQERDERKQAAIDRREEEEERKLLKIIENKGVSLASMKVDKDSKLNTLLLTNLESHNPSQAKVYVDQDGRLNWPVMFLYPEHTQTDFIEAFNEQNTFTDHLLNMFGPEVERAKWDLHHKYSSDNIEVYFEDKENEKLYLVDSDSTLLKALQHKKYKVHAGTPSFIILAKDTRFREEFLNNYKQR